MPFKHLFVYFACFNFCPFSRHPGVRDWLLFLFCPSLDFSVNFFLVPSDVSLSDVRELKRSQQNFIIYVCIKNCIGIQGDDLLTIKVF